MKRLVRAGAAVIVLPPRPPAIAAPALRAGRPEVMIADMTRTGHQGRSEFAYRPFWVNWTVSVMTWFAGMCTAVGSGGIASSALRWMGIDIRTLPVGVGLGAALACAVPLVFTILTLREKFLRRFDVLFPGQPIILDDFGILFDAQVKGFARWQDVKNVGELRLTKSAPLIRINFRHPVALTYGPMTSLPGVSLNQDRILPSARAFLAEAQRLHGAAPEPEVYSWAPL